MHFICTVNGYSQKMAIPKIEAFLTHGFMSNETFFINSVNKCELNKDEFDVEGPVLA